jgi:hypothetical protein
VKDEAIYRCIHAACARALPRRVNFCPYCGTGQHAAVINPAHGAANGSAGAAPVAAAGAVQVDIAKPGAGSTGTPPAFPAANEMATRPVAAAAKAAHPSAAPQAGAPGTGRDAGPPARPARPPGREPIRLRWWLLALAALWAIWLVAKPTDKKIVARIDKAVALAIECKASEAQSELIALRSSRATPQQLARLQQELNDAAAECKRARQRNKAWSDASAAVEAALALSSFEKARSRLLAFTRRWGEDEESRALKAKVDGAAPREHPLASAGER